MRIGIDIDDVITDTSVAMKKYIREYDKDGEISKHIEEVMRGEMPTPNIRKFFADNIINIYKDTKVKENVSEVVKRLLDSGNEIYLITARGEKKFKDSERYTLEFLNRNDIRYTKVFFNSFEKAKICEENKVDLMIDDSVKYCEEVNNKNIKSIVFTSCINKSINTKIERVNTWLELEYKINNIKKEIES